MKKIKVAFNGLGRIGKNIARVVVEKFGDRISMVAANDLIDPAVIADSLPRDSTYGRFPAEVGLSGGNTLAVGEHEIALYAEEDPAAIPWGKHGVDLVFECTGVFRSTEKAGGHLAGGAKKVIVSAPCSDDTKTVVVGVNHDVLDPADEIVSNASCTTNCLAPMTKALDDTFEVVGGLMSTTHAATLSERVLDSFGERGALNNIIPGSTGAAIAIGKVMPHLDGKLNGSALRVPTDTGSVVEAVYLIRGEHGRDEIVSAMEENINAINGPTILKQVACIGGRYQCSADCRGEPFSAMISDAILTVPCGGDTLVKVTGFYDNEAGFSHRMVELSLLMTGGVS